MHNRYDELIAVPVYNDESWQILEFLVKVKKGVKAPPLGLYDRSCFDFPIRLLKALMKYDCGNPPEREMRVITYAGLR